MFDSLLEFVGGSAWAYVAIFVIVTVDAFFPVVPGETSVVTGAILAANGELSVLLVFASGMAGALTGDEKAAGRVRWARRQLQKHGPAIIVAARFVRWAGLAATSTRTPCGSRC